MKYAMENSIKPEAIFRGSKILSMTFKDGLNLYIIDTLRFLPMRLADMHDAFGLKTGAKGWYPYFFSTRF